VSARRPSRVSGPPPAIVAVLLALGLLGLFASTASALDYTVDSKGDEPDASIGTNGCKTAANVCSLRAAIQESNNSTAVDDRISFDFTVFKGDLASKITLGAGLPAITDKAEVNGSSCVTAAPGSISGPCVEVGVPLGQSGLTVETDDVSINGLSVTGGGTGIDIIDASSATEITQSWLGVKLDGSNGGNGTGIFIHPDSNNAVIGGSEAGQRNVISNNGTGLDILGADSATIRGNFFGVTPNGQTAAGNTIKDIEITDSTEGAGFKAQNNIIGVALPRVEAPTTACDKGCNVISGSQYGIDLDGDESQEEAPATGPTPIDSNYIGLKPDGISGAIPNTKYGIMVGAAKGVSIGGSPAQTAFRSTNVITGGEFGIFAAEAESLQIYLNVIGGNVFGGQLTPPSVAGIFNLALGVIEPATIQSNFVRMGGGVGIEQRFTGSLILGNTILGGRIGILTKVSGGEGNLIENNGIEGAAEHGILIEDDDNEVVGNFIDKSGGAGIRIQTPLDEGKLPSTGNLIGGPSGDLNSFFENGGPAIEISNLEDSDNEVAENNGDGNAGPFIELVSANAGTDPNGPNHGIKPPTISSATLTMISGTALAGAKVLVFRKASAEPGELESFIGKATADGTGAWSLAYADQNEEAVTLPAGTNVAALQTSTTGGSSELALSTAVTPKEPKEEGNGGSGGSTNPADNAPPQTKITKGPKAKSSSTKVKFKFSSTEAGSTFQCKLDRKPFKPCRSPKKYSGLKPGKHVFKVRAIDAAGNTDSSPAVKKFKVLG
jgi:CSLREA domain-containing protein